MEYALCSPHTNTLCRTPDTKHPNAFKKKKTVLSPVQERAARVLEAGVGRGELEGRCCTLCRCQEVDRDTAPPPALAPRGHDSASGVLVVKFVLYACLERGLVGEEEEEVLLTACNE